MASRRNRPINLPAPYLKRIWLDPSKITDRDAYPFCLPLLRDDFELSFDKAITIIVGENGTGKSTLLEGIAVLAGYDEAGGGKGYMPVDHTRALEKMGGRLSSALRASWLPKMAGSFVQRASFPSRVILMRPLWTTRLGLRRPTSFRILTAKASCVSSKSAASGKASSSSTSRNPRCRLRARSRF
jgi:energy-coupling factor transporter ATP-binding protein EcfA2